MVNGEGIEDKMRGGGVLQKKNERGGMPERGKEDEMRGEGGVRKKLRGVGLCRRG